MQEFNEGDLVEAVKGEAFMRARLVPDGGSLRLDVSPYFLPKTDILIKDGYALTVIEKAAPKLPTEVGFYLTRHNALWTLEKSGNWKDDHDVWASWDAAHNEAPFTRLEPAPVTVKKVLDAIRQRIGSIDSAHDFQAVATQFGVTE